MGRYNEYENLRKAGVTYADITGYQFDRHDVTARGIANWYAQTLGTIFTESNKPFEVEIVVAEVGITPGDDQIYRITFDGSVTDEPGFVAFGGQADQVSAALKERYADITGYQFDRHDVTARGIANWYAQTLGTIFTDQLKPYEVEIVVAEVGERPEGDQIYRITFDGSVNDEPGFVAFGGQADQVSAVLKERYSPGMSLSGAFAAALAALSAPGNGGGNDAPGVQLQLEVAILDRTRDHRTFRRIRAARLEELISQSREADSKTSQAPQAPASPGIPADPGTTDSAGPPIGPDATSTDRGGGLSGGDTPPSPL